MEKPARGELIKPVEKLDEIEDLQYLVELSETMKDEEIASLSIAVAGFVLDTIRKQTRRDS